MSPPRKKARSSAGLQEDAPAELEPIVFASPGLPPDVRLKVFDQEYHVHATLLKLHSNYFRRFLDSREKSAPSSGERGGFQYDYSTVVDDDGTWGLEPSKTTDVIENAGLEKVDVPREKKAFYHLLCAYYNRSYLVKDFTALKSLVKVADFYCSLPIVSATLIGALIGSQILHVTGGNLEVPSRCIELLLMAKKLRHKVLFGECFILTVSHFDPRLPDSQSMLKGDPSVLGLVALEYARISALIRSAQNSIIDGLSNGQLTFSKNTVAVFSEVDADTAPARFFRSLESQLNAPKWASHKHLLMSLSDLLDNNLDLRQYDPYDEYGNFLLCAELSDKDMPWNQDEIDW